MKYPQRQTNLQPRRINSREQFGQYIIGSPVPDSADLGRRSDLSPVEVVESSDRAGRDIARHFIDRSLSDQLIIQLAALQELRQPEREQQFPVPVAERYVHPHLKIC